jgi:phosphohistidine swiveling domain-containing protein
VKKQIKFSKKFFASVKAKDFSKMSSSQLADDFEKTLKYNVKPWKDYYCTDYFSTDKVSAVFESGNKRYDLKLLEKNMKKMGHLKFLQRSTLNETMYGGGMLDKYRKEINKRFKLPYDASCYSYSELIDLLRGKKVKIPDRSIWIRGKFSKGKDILGREAERIIKNLSAVHEGITELKGNIGNKGHYIGKVKKIEMDTKKHSYSEDIDKMKKGDVLVSGTTGPELILACKKAGAIITEEGGIISHAAIVSRELGIPSIIGTKIATKVLKDGDLVEVDANNGIVKILKRK